MTDVGDQFKRSKRLSQEKRSNNRKLSALYLKRQNIRFKNKNNGAHLIVEGNEGLIAFWPGTGRWISREDNKVRHGVKYLVKYIKGNEYEDKTNH